jgi:hypothetical protein
MTVKHALATGAKVIAGAFVYYVGFILGGVIAGATGLPAPALPAGADAATLGLYQLLISLIFTATLAVLSRRLAGSFLLRWATLALFSWVAYGLNTYLEAAIFTAYEAASVYTLVMQASAAVLCSGAVAWMFAPRAVEMPVAPRVRAFLGRHTALQWAWRILAAWVAFPVVYLTFGWLVQPFIIDFYRQQMAGLTLPGWDQILPTQALRGLFFLLACLPLLILWQGSRRRLFLLLGSGLFIFVGGLYMLQAYWYPAVMRIVHSLEILADSFVYASALVALLATGGDQHV